MESGALDAV